MKHLAVIQVIDYIIGGLYLIGAFIIISLSALGAGALGLSGQQGADVFAFIFGSFGLVAGGFSALFGILSIVAANALVKGRLWSRIVHIIIAVLWNLWIFPVGTAFAVYCLWALIFNNELKDHFSGSSPQYAGDNSTSDSQGGSGSFDF